MAVCGSGCFVFYIYIFFWISFQHVYLFDVRWMDEMFFLSLHFTQLLVNLFSWPTGKPKSIYGIWRAKIFENKISKWECVRFSLIILVDFNFLFSAIVAAAAAAVVGFNLISFIPMWISTFSTNQKESMKEIRLCLRITKVRARAHTHHSIPFHSMLAE